MPDKQLEVAEGASGPRTGRARLWQAGADVRQVRSAVRGRGAQTSSSTGTHPRGDSTMNVFSQLPQRFHAQTNANEVDLETGPMF